MREAACYLTQGCTTIVTGNCGGGAVDVAEYYQAIEQQPAGVNVAHLIPQGSLRDAVIGESRRAPSDEELAKMQELARQGMQAGAWGMSTGLQYVPGSFANTDELIAIAKAVGEEGGIYASHMRNEGDELFEAIQEALEIGRGGELPVHISHLKASQKRNWGKLRAAAALINEARTEGLRVTADQYPYNASSTSISAMLLSDNEREGGNAAIRKKLDDPAENARLRQLISEALEGRGPIIVASCPEHPRWVGKLISEIAQEEKREPVEVAIDILRSSDQQGVSFSMDDRDLHYAMTLPWVATASDGSVKIADGTNPHPRSFGTFPRKIGRYALEEKILSLEQAIRSATSLPAEILGLKDRGTLEPGTYADIVVFAPDEFRDQATYQSPFEVSTGAKYVFVNGQLAIDEGKLAKTNAGRALRKGGE